MQPVLYALVATVLGLSFAPLYTFPPALGWISLVVFSFFLLVVRLQRTLPLVFIFLIFFILANLRYPLQFPSRHDINQIDQLAKKVMITGKIVDLRQLTEGRSWLLVKVTSIINKQHPLQLDRPLNIRLYLGEGTTDLLPADVIQCSTRLRKPRLFGTPGEFDYPRYLASQNIDMTGWIKNSEKITVIDSRDATFQRWIVAWRNRVAAKIHSLMSDQRAFLTRALVLGEGRVLPDSLRKLLSQSGISHLFAISGLHLGMIGLFDYLLFNFIYRRIPGLLKRQPPQRVLPLILLPLLLAYLMLTGDAVSTRRAFALAACGAIFINWRYHINPLQLLASIAFILLLVNPLLLWQAGWQLSFAGAAGILLWQPLWQRCAKNWYRPARYVVQLFLVTGAATMATLPFVLLNFHLLSPAGLIANLFCVPVITLLALPVGLFALIFEPFLQPAAYLLFHWCGWMLNALVTVAEWLTSVPFFSGHNLFLSRWQYLAVGLFALSFLMIVRSRKRATLIFLALSIVLGASLWQLPLRSQSPVSLTMFSVGQGESMLLQNNYGQAILVDGGGFYSQRFDVGERLLAPAFGELKINQLDAVVLTHDDIDHRKGLVFILKHYPVKQFITGIPVAKLHYTLSRVLREKQIPVKIIPPGWNPLYFWQGGPLSIFNGRVAGCGDNDSSLVMYLDVADNNGLLLTGDLESAGVDHLLSVGVPGHVALLKLPHHGSRFSAITRLLDTLSPRFCLVSSGYQNRYHLPAAVVVDAVLSRHISLYRTDLNGTLQARLGHGGWQVVHWERGLFR